MMAQHFDLPAFNSQTTTTDPTNIRVAIANSTGSDRAVQKLVKTLLRAGYRNVYLSKSWPEPLDVTHIVAQQGDTTSAEGIRNILNLGEVRVESTGNLSSDITIQLGRDWLQQSGGAEEQGG